MSARATLQVTTALRPPSRWACLVWASNHECPAVLTGGLPRPSFLCCCSASSPALRAGGTSCRWPRSSATSCDFRELFLQRSSSCSSRCRQTMTMVLQLEEVTCVPCLRSLTDCQGTPRSRQHTCFLLSSVVVKKVLKSSWTPVNWLEFVELLESRGLPHSGQEVVANCKTIKINISITGKHLKNTFN